MQLYHHAFSLNSQKVRLALEEKGMDYISHSLNPLTGKDLNPNFFRINPEGKIPVIKNGSRVILDTLSIVQFIDSLNVPLGRDNVDKEKLQEWMGRIDGWDPKLFTLSRIPWKIRKYFSRFKRRAAIAMMARNPDLADKYHSKLREAYETEEMLKDREALEANQVQLENLLDAAEVQLGKTDYLAGASFTMADVMLLPVLGWMELLRMDKKLLKSRPRLAAYWSKAKRRPSYHRAIGKYFAGCNKYTTFLTTAVVVSFRDIFRRY